MSKQHTRPGTVVAVALAVTFATMAGLFLAPIAVETLSLTGEVNEFFRPYVYVMAALCAANAVLIFTLVPRRWRATGWFGKLRLWAAIALSLLVLLELGSLLMVNGLLKAEHVGSRYTNGFVFSPSLGFVPKPGFRFALGTGEITHTADGYRGPEAPAETPPSRKTFLMVGGSSTYDLGLPDRQTWPAVLGRVFARQIRVLNLGIPGHSTAEHIALVSLKAWKHRPDVIVYYIGWNDMRSSHTGESTDYARFHKKRMLHNFAITQPTSLFASGYVLEKIIVLLDSLSLHRLTEVEIEPGTVETVDNRLLDIYLHNVRMLAAITREIGAVPVFVPQILNEQRLTGDEPYGWIPRVPQRLIPQHNAVFNKAMIETARAVGAAVIDEVLGVDWQDADFVDRGHFSEPGARRFACMLAAGLMDRDLVVASPEVSETANGPCSPSL